jgi:putative oxidoreductase
MLKFDFGARFSSEILAALRVVTGLLFLAHGLVKMVGFPEGAQPGVQEVGSFLWIAGLIEVVTGGLVTVGFMTRLAAFLASGQMAIAYWVAHAPRSPFPILNGGDAAILYCFIFLYIFAAGPGRFSVDGGMK